MQRALVTGAAGFIGCHLVASLQESGWSVTGIDDERSGDWTRVHDGCRRVHRDLADLSVDELGELCTGADVVFHLAAEKHNAAKATPQRIIDVNISAARRLFEAAARTGARVVFTSSLYAYGSMGPAPMRESDVPTPRTVYGISKLAGELLLDVDFDGHRLDWSVARLFFVYGPRQFARGGYKSVIVSNFERLATSESPTIFGDGRQALDYVYIDDAVEALRELAAPQHHGKTVNVCSGEATNINDLTDMMIETSGAAVTPQSCPPDWTAGSCRIGDPTVAATEIGWKASTPIAAGLRNYWAWLSGGAS